jgi:hypothetical protein
MHLDSVANKFDFMDPPVSHGRLELERGKLRRNKVRHIGRLGTWAHPRNEAGLGTLNHYAIQNQLPDVMEYNVSLSENS